MFDAGEYVIRREIALIASDSLRPHQGDEIRVFSVSLSDPAPSRVSGYFDIGIESPVHIHSPHLCSCLSGYPARKLKVK